MMGSMSKDDAELSTKRSWKHLPSHHRVWLVITCCLLIIVIFFLFHRKPPPPVLHPVPVVLSKVITKDVPVYLLALGNVTSVYTVSVKTEINGVLVAVYYKEGQLVKLQDLLAQIDNRPYLAQLTQYEGQLKRDEALLANALIDLKRYQTLWKQDSVSQQILATQEALVKQYQGNVETDQGLIAATKLNLFYCEIRSPMDGRVGLRLIDPGNFVQTTDTNPMMVLNSVDPITVIFSIPEDDVPKIVPQIVANKAVTVEAYDRLQNTLLATSQLLVTDNQINTTTGTLKLRATFNNKALKLFPNQFVNIKVLVDEIKQASVIPTSAVQYSNNKGKFVYALKADNTVAVTPIKVGVTSGEDTVVLSGLNLGQRVVVDGINKLKNGSHVRELAQKTGVG